MIRYADVDPEAVKAEQLARHSAPRVRNYTARKRGDLRTLALQVIKTKFPHTVGVLCLGARHDAEVEAFIHAGYEAVGCDLMEPTRHIAQVDAHELSDHYFEDEVDVVFACHSLEHMHNAPQVLEEIGKVARLGLIVVLPTDEEAIVPSLQHPTVFDCMIKPWKLLPASCDSRLRDFDFVNRRPVRPVYYKRFPNQLMLAIHFGERQ